MSVLSVYINDENTPFYTFSKPASIQQKLQSIGIDYHKYDAQITKWVYDKTPDELFKMMVRAHKHEIIDITNKYDIDSYDLAHCIEPDADLRKQLMEKHTHEQSELRFFVYGSGTFYFYDDYVLFELFCEAGDLISIPTGMEHWFDIGELPDFACLRFKLINNS